MSLKSMILSIAVLFSLTSAAAAAPCYTSVEVEAEQGLRIHSELMVIALTCVKSPAGGAELYAKYQYFTDRNKPLISAYESDMLRYYKKQGKGAEEKLHNLRTKLANQVSEHAITMSVDQFCQRFAPRIDQALSMDEGKLRLWAQHEWPGSPTTVSECTAGGNVPATAAPAGRRKSKK